MADWRRVLGAISTNVEDRYDTLKLRLKLRLGALDPLVVLPYRGHGNRQALFLRGRVLEHQGITGVGEDDSVWENVLNMYRRFTSDEIAGALVRATFQGEAYDVVTDADGYFDLKITPKRLEPAPLGWHPIELVLLAPKARGQGEVRSTGQILVPPDSAEFGVISDIDDTVVKTSVTDKLKMARIVLLGNAHTRLPFPGVSMFYKALQGGSDGLRGNPIFYVSSSPWNLYDVIVDFFALQDIPLGPLFLRDFGLNDERFFESGHTRHKLERIQPLFETYPQLPFILIGDSGQEDPEIYRQLVHAYPGRVRAIYIRDVVGPLRHGEVLAIRDEVQALGVEMLLLDDTLAAAEHAVRQGYIRPDTLAPVAVEKAQDEAAPSLVEQLLDGDEPAGGGG